MKSGISGQNRRGSESGEAGRAFDTAKFGVLALLILATFFAGGSARVDVSALVWLRPLTVICLTTFLLLNSIAIARFLYPSAALLLAFAATMAIQLVPLPGAVWAGLPGHQMFTDAPFFVASSWRPISLAPDLTWNSMLALLTPLAALVGIGVLTDRHRYWVLTLALLIGGASVVLGIFQLFGGKSAGLYFSSDVDFGMPIGFFANRNHQAAMLATLLPLLRVWALHHRASGGSGIRYGVIAAAAAAVILPVILLTGSRSGLILAFVGAASALAISPVRFGKRQPTLSWVWLFGAIAASAGLLAVFVLSGRADTIARMAGFAAKNEQRLEYLPKMIEIVQNFAPFGSGFGTFDLVFRAYEPAEFLNPTYFNHAHNELVELAMTGGVLPLLVVAGFLLLWARSAMRVWRCPEDDVIYVGRAASVIVLMILLASLTDYPLRTPAIAIYFSIAAGWLAWAADRASIFPSRGPRNPFHEAD